MLDYRQDIIKLMKATDNSKSSLDQSMIALNIICKIYSANSELEDKLKDKSDQQEASSKASNTLEQKENSNSESKNESREEEKEDDSQKDTKDKELTLKEKIAAEKTANQKKARAALSDKVRKNQQKYAAKTSIPKLPDIKKVVHHKKPETETFKVMHKLLGSEAIDDAGYAIQYFNEYTTREFNLENGDTFNKLHY